MLEDHPVPIPIFEDSCGCIVNDDETWRYCDAHGKLDSQRIAQDPAWIVWAVTEDGFMELRAIATDPVLAQRQKLSVISERRYRQVVIEQRCINHVLAASMIRRGIGQLPRGRFPNFPAGRYLQVVNRDEE